MYVRGRGRGKYICEECGIRCKKPSMLKKHIRTHTDVRPYHCSYCNFSFKTKGMPCLLLWASCVFIQEAKVQLYVVSVKDKWLPWAKLQLVSSVVCVLYVSRPFEENTSNYRVLEYP